MNLQKTIKKILREELSIIDNLNQLRRRTYIIDKSVKMVERLAPQEFYRTKEEYLNRLITVVARDLHQDYFVYSDLSDEEWDEIKEFIEQYIIENYS
jgi:endonuclease III-like uncharacterized protein